VRGLIFRLGRLQFERASFPPDRLTYTDPALLALPDPRPTPGALTLALHIPESGGSLSPIVCDSSLAQAHTFFSRYFPEEQYQFARCASWLLDPQLQPYLAPSTNIIQFQQRFHLFPESGNGDQDVLQFVFRRTNLNLADPSPSLHAALNELPQRSSLERAVVAHLQAGKHWQFRFGWFVL
jgi:hypothetical protein